MALPILFRSTPRVGLNPRRASGAPVAGFSLSAEMDSLFDELWRGPGRPRRDTAFVPRMDLTESADEVRVSAELPGIDADALGVDLKDGVLRIRGEKAATTDASEGVGWHRAERNYGAFERRLRIPVEVDIETATATYRDGVLEIALPKAAAAKVVEIPVEVATS